MCRNINFRYNLYKVGCSLFLKINKFFFRIRTVAGCESRISFGLQTESSISLVPVVIKILLESIIIQMDLQGIHLVISHYFYQILKIAHRNKFTTAVYHESPDGVVGVVADYSFRK